MRRWAPRPRLVPGVSTACRSRFHHFGASATYPQLMHTFTHRLIPSLSTWLSPAFPPTYPQPRRSPQATSMPARCRNAMLQDATRERESFSFTRGSRAIGKAFGVAHSTAARWARNRLLPCFRLGRRWVLAPSAVAPYQLALARELLRRGQPVVAAQQGPGGGGLMPASGADGPTPVRCKKMTPKEFDAPVVTLE